MFSTPAMEETLDVDEDVVAEANEEDTSEGARLIVPGPDEWDSIDTTQYFMDAWEKGYEGYHQATGNQIELLLPNIWL
jgi:hypothetical protein